MEPNIHGLAAEDVHPPEPHATPRAVVIVMLLYVVGGLFVLALIAGAMLALYKALLLVGAPSGFWYTGFIAVAIVACAVGSLIGSAIRYGRS